jgi:ADP-heptose:LPS heptosyltransferase
MKATGGPEGHRGMEVRLRLLAWRKAMLRAAVPLFYGIRAGWRGQGRGAAIPAPRRILLMNGAHIGDVVIATSLLPVLRQAFPQAEIGFLVGSWAEMVVRNHPDVRTVHLLDHWRFNRGAQSTWQKMRRYGRMHRAVVRELREAGYDVAIGLYPQFPDLLNVALAARIPARIGFRSSFYGSLATALVDEPTSPFAHQGRRMAETLKPLGIGADLLEHRRSSLPPSDAAATEEVCRVLGVPTLDGHRYVVIHMGSAAAQREFPLSFWRDLAVRVSAERQIVFTGRGSREKQNIAQAMAELPNCIDACDRLSWNGFVAAVRHAEILFGVESMAGHVAGAVGTRCMVVYGGAAGVARWRPEGPGSLVFTNHVPCAPCHLPMGCAEMYCMQGIHASDLVRIGLTSVEGRTAPAQGMAEERDVREGEAQEKA